MKYLLSICIILGTSFGFAQSKKDLENKIIKQDRTIDSLKKVIANYENIVENRDRSINIMKEDVETFKQEKLDAEAKTREKHAIIQKLRKESSTGVSKFITLNNNKPAFKIKEGKYIVVNQFMTDFTSSITTDSLGDQEVEEIHVYLKSINDEVLTDPANKKYGPKVYSSLHPEKVIRFPLIFTENMKFSIIVFKGKEGELYPHNGTVYCSFTEKDMK